MKMISLASFTDPSQKARQKEISEFLEDLRELGIGEQPAALSAAGSHTPNAKDNEEQEEETSPAMCKLLHDWVPLELSFGIPLFDDEANRSVSDKVMYYRRLKLNFCCVLGDSNVWVAILFLRVFLVGLSI